MKVLSPKLTSFVHGTLNRCCWDERDSLWSHAYKTCLQNAAALCHRVVKTCDEFLEFDSTLYFDNCFRIVVA